MEYLLRISVVLVTCKYDNARNGAVPMAFVAVINYYILKSSLLMDLFLWHFYSLGKELIKCKYNNFLSLAVTIV